MYRPVVCMYHKAFRKKLETVPRLLPTSLHIYLMISQLLLSERLQMCVSHRRQKTGSGWQNGPGWLYRCTHVPSPSFGSHLAPRSLGGPSLEEPDPCRELIVEGLLSRAEVWKHT